MCLNCLYVQTTSISIIKKIIYINIRHHSLHYFRYKWAMFNINIKKIQIVKEKLCISITNKTTNIIIVSISLSNGKESNNFYYTKITDIICKMTASHY